MAHAAAPPAGMQAPGIRDTVARGLHIGIVVSMIFLVTLGFWPFYGGLPGSGTQALWVVSLHAAVFVGWMALLLVQVVPVHRRRILGGLVTVAPGGTP